MNRYQRQIILPEIGLSGQQKLKNSRVLVVGAGGLGCPVLSYLAAAGVGNIKIADGDIVDYSNLHRQVLYGDRNVSKKKALEAARILSDQNPTINILPIAENIAADNVRHMLNDVDLVLDGSDNFATKYLLNDACVELNKILISGSIFCFEGQLSVFNYKGGPTYRCLYPEPPSAELIPSCAEAGVLGVLPGVIGTLQATEALKILLEIGQVLSGRLLLFDALRLQFDELEFKRLENANIKIQSESYYKNLMRQCQFESISAEALKKKLDAREEVILIDVREIAEKQEFDIGGELIPLGTLLKNAHRIPKDRPVILYCRAGSRSARGIAELKKEFGFTNLLNLEGGILAWQKI